MKISKATIVRTVMLCIAIVNMLLERFGLDIIKTDGNLILSSVEAIIELGTVAAAWWYNNSFSKNALRAQHFLEELRQEDFYV